jgi:transmembrane sensor
MRPWLHNTATARNASRWFARLRSAEVTDRVDNEFGRWLRSDSRNEQEFERRELIWDMLGDLQDDPETAKLIRETNPPLRRWHAIGSRKSWLAAAAVLVGVSGLSYWSLRHPNIRSADQELILETRIGEQKQAVLPDGSRVKLNTATRLNVRYRHKTRLLQLERGEAIFFVRHDVSRPFDVIAGGTTTRAVGTTFNILYTNDTANIAVVAGTVQVETTVGPSSQRHLLLGAGQASTFTRINGLGPPEAAQLTRIASWQAQRIEFDNTTLAAAVTDFNRYSSTAIELGDPALASIRVSGVFRFNDAPGFARALHSTFGVVTQTRGSSIVLLPSPGP